MDLYRSMSGIVSVKLVSADIPGCLRVMQQQEIVVWDVKPLSILTITFQIRFWDYRKLRQLMKRRGASMEMIGSLGMFWKFLPILHRPILVLGISVILLLSLYLPSRVLFIRVEGNTTIPTQWILEQAQECGIRAGCHTRNVRSETLKNHLLSQVEGLQWAGINTYGCVAVISVRERVQNPQEQSSQLASSIVASRDGVVLHLVAEKGSLVCKVGEAVIAGQTLISGYTDHGTHISATQASGEVIGLTERTIFLCTPAQWTKKGEKLSAFRKYSLVIGKKRINFVKDSGILDASCARIYSEWYMTLPGGFQLPIGILCEEYITYAQAGTAENAMDLSAAAKGYILSDMTAGTILRAMETLDSTDDFLFLRGRYACSESLGITRIEENFEKYGENP